MKSRIVTVLSVAVAMALPVGGALAQSGTSASDTSASDTSADAAATVDTGAGGAAQVTLGANASARARAAVDAAPAREGAPPDAPPVTDVGPTDVPPTDVPRTDAPATDARPTDQRPTDARPTDERPEREPEHEVFRVGDAGAVALWWTPRQFVDLEVRVADGWRYEAWRESPRLVKVAFASPTHGYLFTAAITEDGALRTHVEERERDVQTTTERYEVGEAGTVGVTYSVHGIHDVAVVANDGWRHRIHRVDRRTVRVGFTNGEVAYLFTAHVTEDGSLRTHIERRAVDRPTDERPSTDRPADLGPSDGEQADDVASRDAA